MTPRQLITLYPAIGPHRLAKSLESDPARVTQVHLSARRHITRMIANGRIDPRTILSRANGCALWTHRHDYLPETLSDWLGIDRALTRSTLELFEGRS